MTMLIDDHLDPCGISAAVLSIVLASHCQCALVYPLRAAPSLLFGLHGTGICRSMYPDNTIGLRQLCACHDGAENMHADAGRKLVENIGTESNPPLTQHMSSAVV